MKTARPAQISLFIPNEFMQTQNPPSLTLTDLEPSILLVEDDHLDSLQLERELRKLNITNPLHVARNGREALEMLHGGRIEKIEPQPGVVILDINMPRLNGFEFLYLLRKDPELKDLKVFILTTSNDTAERNLARDLGAAGYLVKPFTQEHLSAEQASSADFQLLLQALQAK